MRLRYEAIKRDQDRMVAEMERAVMKREVIAQKYKKSGKKNHGAPAAMTTADLKKKRSQIRREARGLPKILKIMSLRLQRRWYSWTKQLLIWSGLLLNTQS